MILGILLTIALIPLVIIVQVGLAWLQSRDEIKRRQELLAELAKEAKNQWPEETFLERQTAMDTIYNSGREPRDAQ